jgi:branched-chain amino acid transport system permease protein
MPIALAQSLVDQLWLGLVSGVVLAVFCIGLVVLFGVMRVVNMAHGALFMAGAVGAALLQAALDLPFFVALAAAVLLVGVGGLCLNRCIIGPIERKLGGDPDTLSAVVLLETLALGLAIYQGTVLIFGSTTRPLDTDVSGVLDVAGLTITLQSLMLLAVGVAAVVGLHLFFTRTFTGKAMRAASTTRTGASLVGININRMYDWAWFLGCGLAALAGALVAPLAAADPTMGQDMLVRGFAVIVAAGLTSFVGVGVLAVALSIAGAIFSTYVSTYYEDAFIFMLMVAILLVRPRGLFTRNQYAKLPTAG